MTHKKSHHSELSEKQGQRYSCKCFWVGKSRLPLLSSVQFSHSIMSDSLRFHGLQRARLPYPSLYLGAWSNSYPSSWWCCLTTSSSATLLLLLPSVFPSIRVFSNESPLFIRWPKSWNFSFSISPSNEYSGLISFRIDRFGLGFLAVQGNLKSLLKSLRVLILWCSAFFMVLTHRKISINVC